MPRNTYFEQYKSPNIIIVPTVNICLPPPPTGLVKIPDPIINSPLKKYEEISPVKDNIFERSPSDSNCNLRNLQIVNTKAIKSTSAPGFSENIRNSPSILKNTISTELSSCSMSQSIKELSTSKFKSRNNLVDLTGFNLMKRDSASWLPKRQDFRAIDDTKMSSLSKRQNLRAIDDNKISSLPKRQDLRAKSDINISSLSKRQDLKAIDTKIKRDKTSASSTDLRNKITEGSKKYRDHERKVISEHPNRSNSNTNRRHLPDPKVSVRHRGIGSPDSIRRYKDVQRSIRQCDDRENKYKRENEIKTKDLLRKKIRIESSETIKIKPDVKKKESKEHETCKKSEKCGELTSSVLSNLEMGKNHNNIKAKHQNSSNRVVIKSVVRGDRKLPNNLSQRIDVDGVQDLRSRLSRKRPRSKCSENHEPMEKKPDRKSSVKPVTQNAEADLPLSARTEPKPKIRKPNELINKKCLTEPKPKICKPNELINKKCLTKPKPMIRKPNELINKKCPTEPKPKISKPNELINKKCPAPDSGDSDEDSLLNYFMTHGDEIVASMYKPPHTDIELSEQAISDNKNSEGINSKTGLIINNKKSIKINKEETSSHKAIEINSINKTNENDSKSNDDAKSKVDLNNHINKRAIEIIQEEENSLQNQVNNKNEKSKPKGLIFKIYMKVVKVNSDTENEDTNFEIGSIAYTKKHKDVKDVDQSPKTHKNSQQMTNNKIDITKKDFDELVPKDTISLCNDKLQLKTNSQIEINTKQQVNNITASTDKSSERKSLEETTSIRKDKQKITTKPKMEIKEKANNITKITGKTCGEIGTKETISICMDKQKIKTNSINKKTTKQKANNTIDLTGKACKEIAPKVTKSLCMDKQKITLNSNYEKSHIPETNNIIDLTGKAYEENALKEAIEISDTNDSIVEVIDITGAPEYDQPNVNINSKSEIDRSEKASLQPIFNIDQNKSISNPSITYDVLKLLTNLKKQVKDKNDNVKDNVEAKLETMFNKLEEKSTINKHIEPKEIHGCVEKFNENSIQKSVDPVEVTLETIFNGTKQDGTCINMDTQKTTLSGQLINKELSVLETTQETIKAVPETTINNNILDRNDNVSQKIKMTNVTVKNIATEPESANQILSDNHSAKQNVAIKIDAEPLKVSYIQEKCSQNSGMAIAPLRKSNKTFKENGHIFEDTVNKPTNNIEKKTQKPLLSDNKPLLDSNDSTKEGPETSKSSLVQNNEAQDKIVPKSGTIQKSSKNITNEEQKTSTTTIKSNISDKNTVIKPDIHKEEKSEQKATVKAEKGLATKYKEFLSSINKSDESEMKNQNKSQETIKNNAQKPQSNEDTVSDTKNSNNKISNKNSDLEKSVSVTNTKAEQEKKDANNTLVPINKDDTKSIDQEHLSRKMRACISKLEAQMFESLKKKYTLSSLIHSGRFSTIIKCFDTKGESYAVKIANHLNIRTLDNIFYLLQQHQARQNSCVLYLVNTFECHNHWCLLTEYFPKNLHQVLYEKKQGFHIDRVQVLATQLVDAVNMLTNAGIIHSDIKPNHVLLNDANDRLKLCGFDRSDFSGNLTILPSTGTPRYRAPEIILGFQADHKIDVWSTALVIFEMATKKPLFNAYYNNALLYQHILTFGSFDWTMVEQSRYGALYFSGTSFKRQLGRHRYEEVSFIKSLHRTEYLRNQLFKPYSEQNRTRGTTKWQITKEMDKVETLHTLLQQMLTLDPRHRLPIQFVNASEFMNP